MPRPVTPTTRAALLAPESAEAFVTLVTIDHPDLAAPIRVTNAGQDIVSRGETFVAMPFVDEKPGEDETGVTAGRLAIQNVSREIAQAIRAVFSPPSVLIEVVRAADPDAVEMSLDGLSIREAGWDSLVAEASVDSEDFLSEPYPKDSFTPGLFPGVF